MRREPYLAERALLREHTLRVKHGSGAGGGEGEGRGMGDRRRLYLHRFIDFFQKKIERKNWEGGIIWTALLNVPVLGRPYAVDLSVISLSSPSPHPST